MKKNKLIEIDQLISAIEFNGHMQAIYQHQVKVAQKDIYKALENVCLQKIMAEKLQDELHGKLFDLMLHTSYSKFIKLLKRMGYE